jgi:hypothetical protein
MKSPVLLPVRSKSILWGTGNILKNTSRTSIKIILFFTTNLYGQGSPRLRIDQMRIGPLLSW